MREVVSAIYITIGTLLFTLTYFDGFYGPRWIEGLGIGFVFIGIIYFILFVIKRGNGKSENEDIRKF
ncbi:hypothetical protein CIL05_19100 [Virgibacillus profundi]|uniref:Uncharacterized protein n=1 Tax=Virgibacillus profundi TaxID=2024555 RepID=A0A2A2IA17_9BACI|nr:hypothetical protein [Virgibacillus profundi]PAV27975.1 hypothetical protein CIL05_19100 [Virgibacillus profundi]PXY52153.1 hypothetical protein CIT14_19200 [Virgibacillus profundi]